MRHNLASLRSQLNYVGQALLLVWRATRRWTLVRFALLILQSLALIVTVYLTRTLVDSLVKVSKTPGDWVDMRPTLFLVALMAGVILFTKILQSMVAWVRTAQTELVQDYISSLIHTKALTIDLAFYDSPDYYDHLHRARADAINRPFALLENLGNLLQNSLTFIAMAGVLAPFGLWLPVALLLSMLPTLVIVARSSLRTYEWHIRTTTEQRWVRYYDRLLTDRKAAAELRLFTLGDHFQSIFQTLRRGLRNEHLQLAHAQLWGTILANTLGLLITGLAFVGMVWRATQGLITLGDLALFYQAFSQGQRLLQTLLDNVGQIYSNTLFLENLFAFLTLKTAVTATPALPAAHPPLAASKLGAGLHQGIAFDQVCFCYPGSSRLALENFNLWIPAGQIVAIVGENGAGKSTLLKLLCRFYDPEQGTITFDGIDLRTWSPTAVWPLITVLFQQPVRYYTTVAQNIALGDLAAQPTRAMLEQAAQAASAATPIAKLPQGYDTLLGKWFGGAELSDGDWQRLALARAFVRQTPIIVLDEPTSALDSWAEADWMARFRQLATGRTAIIITHRFTTAMQADMIQVMAQGQIVESGAHHELLNWGGRYAQSWRQQTGAQSGTNCEASIRLGKGCNGTDPTTASTFGLLNGRSI